MEIKLAADKLELQSLEQIGFMIGRNTGMRGPGWINTHDMLVGELARRLDGTTDTKLNQARHMYRYHANKFDSNPKSAAVWNELVAMMALLQYLNQ